MNLSNNQYNLKNEKYNSWSVYHLSVFSEEQFRCDPSWAVWDLGEGAWWRLFHLTQLPREIPTREGMYLHYRRWGFHLFVFLFTLPKPVSSVLILTCFQPVFFLPASPRQCIDLFFDERYSIEPSWECKFDHIEVRDGPFAFSPIIGRYCGQESPTYVRSSGRYLYIKFVADGELEAIGFSARYNFTQGEWWKLTSKHLQRTELLLIFWFSPISFPAAAGFVVIKLSVNSLYITCLEPNINQSLSMD